MVFAHDTSDALTATAALVNSGPQPPDRLTTVADLDRFCAEHGMTGSRTHSADEVAEVRAVRSRLRELWSDDRDAVVAVVNELLAENHALPQLARHPDPRDDSWYDWHLHATTPEAPVASRFAVEAAMALVDVVRMNELDRLRSCAADDCDNVLVDLSRNRSRRFCDDGCGNRANVAAYRARRKADGD